MDWKELQSEMMMYHRNLINDGTPLDLMTITSIVCSFIADTRGAENLSSIHDTHPREGLYMRFKDKYDSIKKEILNDDSEGMLDFWYIFLEDKMEREDFDKFARYDGKLFIKAIKRLREDGEDIYLSNYEKFIKQVWTVYRPLLAKADQKKQKKK